MGQQETPTTQLLVDAIADQIADRVIGQVLHRLPDELKAAYGDKFEFGWLEKDAAPLLDCSEQALAKERRAKNIDSTTNPAGRPFYLPHHLWDYLMRRELKHGKQLVTLADVVNFTRREINADNGDRKLQRRSKG